MDVVCLNQVTDASEIGHVGMVRIFVSGVLRPLPGSRYVMWLALEHSRANCNRRLRLRSEVD